MSIRTLMFRLSLEGRGRKSTKSGMLSSFFVSHRQSTRASTMYRITKFRLKTQALLSDCKRSVNFEMSFLVSSISSKNKWNQVDLRFHSSKVEFDHSFWEKKMTKKRSKTYIWTSRKSWASSSNVITPSWLQTTLEY